MRQGLVFPFFRQFMLCLILFSALLTKSQQMAFFDQGLFHIPGKGPFLETYFTFVGNALSTRPLSTGYQNSVRVALKIKGDNGYDLEQSYNVLGPVYTNSLNAPTFLDVQRYSLKPGSYTLQCNVYDNNNTFKQNSTFKSVFTANFKPDSIRCSSIELIETSRKTDSASTLTKSGLELIPYTVNYYPESQNQLKFYLEAYHADSVLGQNRSILYTCQIQNQSNQALLSQFGFFQKQKSAAVNPLFGKLDIRKLSTGTYALVVELRDENNILRMSARKAFMRLNMMQETESVASSKKTSFAEFFENRNQADSIKMMVESLWPIADGIDKERIINTAIKKDVPLMKNYIIDFWTRRAADTAKPFQMWMRYYGSVQETMILFRCGKQKGYAGDRGRVYLQYGKPNQRTIENYEPNTYPYEIWQYYRTTDASTGRYYSNRKFVFVNRAIGDDCHQLVHSDMPGEINNPRWRFEVTRRNNDGKANLENENPNGTQYNQFDEIYSNPR